LDDGEEILQYFTNATAKDTDGDTLSDFDELRVHFTNATNVDTDGDTYADNIELAAETDPNDPLDFPTDPDPGTITPTDGTTTPSGGEGKLPLELIIGGGVVGMVAIIGIMLMVKKRK